MGLFKEIATPLIAQGVPVIPLRPKTKIAFINGWETQATVDATKVDAWDQENQEYNGACVAYARPDGVWFLEIDKPGFAQIIQQETGEMIPDTFMVRSSPGRGHYYFRQTPASIAMGNAQGKDSDGKESWSARVDNRYVVAPGSYHPTSGKRYEIAKDVPIIPAPDWLVKWCTSKKAGSVSLVNNPRRTGVYELDSEDPIIEGNRNNALTSILGKARQVMNMDANELFTYGLSVNEKRCRPPLSEKEVRTIAESMSKYAVVPVVPVIFGAYDKQQSQDSLPPVHIEPVPYPVFPQWVMKKTSLGEGLVDPICAVNNSYPEFIFMPAVVMMMNYLSGRVSVKDRNIIPNMYMVSIGWAGKAYKTSGVKAAKEHFAAAGMVEDGGTVRNAEGRSLVFVVGSTEGLGLEMSRTNCKNAIIFYDEFKTLVDKASIEKSSMLGHLLTMYDGATFSNTKTNRRETFTHQAGQYCASLIANCSDKAFPRLWGRIPDSEESGWNDRFFFLFQPEKQLPFKTETYVNTGMGSLETRKRVDKAIERKIYELSNPEMLEAEAQKLGKAGARAAKLIEKLALYFAVDLGEDEISENCIERAAAIVKYGLSVKKYLQTFESVTREGALQQEIIRHLMRNDGAMKERDFNRVMHPERYGTNVWERSYRGLIGSGWIREDGNGTRGNPKQIILLRAPEQDEE